MVGLRDDGVRVVMGGYRGSDPQPQRDELFQGVCSATRLGKPSVAEPRQERPGTRIGGAVCRNPGWREEHPLIALLIGSRPSAPSGWIIR